MTLEIHAVSDPGLERKTNEDAFLVVDVVEPERGLGGRTEAELTLRDRPCLIAVADGMGGAAAGELASELALKRVSRRVVEAAGNGGPPADPDGRVEWLVEAVEEANRAVLAGSRSESSARGMGTTLTAAIVDDAWCALAHVGDSRAYHLRDGRLTQLTVDHSFVRAQVARGRLTPERAETHDRRNQLLEALGVHERPDVDRLRAPLEAGDRLLLCSDGLYDLVKDGELARMLARDLPPAAQTAELVGLARARGGFDNITAVVAHVA